MRCEKVSCLGLAGVFVMLGHVVYGIYITKFVRKCIDFSFDLLLSFS